MSRLEISPKFHGITRTNNNKHFVSDFIYPSILTNEMIMTIDLQFLVTMKGEVYIIDPDLYQEASDIFDLNIQNKEFEFLYQYFKNLH